MSIVKCRKCSGQVINNAFKCVHCGVQRPGERSYLSVAMSGAAVLLGLTVIMWALR